MADGSPASSGPLTPEPTGRVAPDPDAGHPRMQEAAMWNTVAYLIAGPVLFGGLGLACDHWLGSGYLVLLGLLGGMALSLYLVWFRYGTHQQ